MHRVRRTVALLVASAVVVVVGVLVVESERVPQVEPEVVHTTPTTAAPAPVVLPEAAASVIEPIAVADPPESAAVEGAPAAGKDRPELRVLVIDEDDEPLAGLPVSLQARSPELPVFVDFESATSGENGMARLAWPRKLSEEGGPPAGTRVRVALALPLVPPVFVDLGSAPDADRLVALVVPRSALDWLEPLRVLVLDSQGVPVGGVTVELVATPVHSRRQSNTLDRGETVGVTGVAEIPRHKFIEHLRRSSLMGFSMSHRVLVDGAFEHPPSAIVGIEPTGEPVTLQLPPAGDVTVRVSDAQGVPVEAGPTVALFTRPAGADDDVRWERMHRHIRSVTEGRVHFPSIGLGLELSLSLGQAGWKGSSLRALGPTRDAEQVELSMSRGAPVPSLVGRVVDAAGEPLARTWLRATFVPNVPPPETGSSPPSSNYVSMTSDDDGVFRNPLYEPAFVEGGRTVEIEELRRAGFPRGVVPLHARAPLPQPLPDEGDVDLGELVMRPLPVLVSGIVVDGQGVPVNQAWLWLRRPYGVGDAVRWLNLNVQRPSTARDGTFAVHGLHAVRELEVSASRNGVGASEAQVVSPGTTGVRLELVPPEPEPEGGTVEGQVLLDPEIPGLTLEVFLRWKGGSEDDYVSPFGSYRFEAMPPGVARVVIETQQTDFTVAEVTGVVVRVGETTRVDPIDLRGQLRHLLLRVIKPNGHPLADSWCWIKAPDGTGGSFRTDRDGRAAVLVRTRDELFGIRTSGWEPVECAWSEGEQTLLFDSPADG